MASFVYFLFEVFCLNTTYPVTPAWISHLILTLSYPYEAALTLAIALGITLITHLAVLPPSTDLAVISHVPGLTAVTKPSFESMNLIKLMYQ